MLKKTKLGFASLALGIIFTVIGSKNYLSASADTLSPVTVRTVGVSLFIGVGLIILSVAFFVWANKTAEKD